MPAGEVDPAQLDRLLEADPVAHAFVAAHVESYRGSRGSRIPPVVGTAGPDWLPVQDIGEGFLWVAAALTLITGWDYLRAGLKHLTGMPQ